MKRLDLYNQTRTLLWFRMMPRFPRSARDTVNPDALERPWRGIAFANYRTERQIENTLRQVTLGGFAWVRR